MYSSGTVLGTDAFIYSAVLSTYCAPGPVQASGDSGENKTTKSLPSWGFHSAGGVGSV